MARETKFGVALMVLLLGVFGFVAYKKWDGLKSAVASATAGGKAAGGEANPAPKPEAPSPAVLQPEGNPFAVTEPTPAPPVSQTEPDDPFAGTSTMAGQVPARQVSVVTGDGPAEAPPFAQQEPAEAQPIAQADQSQTAPFERVEPVAAAPEAFSDMAATEPTAGAGDDPFGAAAATPQTDPVADAGKPMPVEDPFGAVSAEAAPTAVSDAAPAAEAADDPFAGADAAAGVGEPDAGPPTDSSDPFGTASDVASAEVGVPAAGKPPAEVAGDQADDPFGAVEEVPAAAAAPATSDMAESLFQEPEPERRTSSPVAEAGAPAESDFAAAEPEPPHAAPAATPSAAPASSIGRTDYCLVGENESYWSISKRVYGTPTYFHALAKHNERRVPDPKKLRPGMSVLTPSAEELQARYPALVTRGEAPAETGARPGFMVDAAGRPAYRVGADDTLGKIAQAHLGRASRWVQIYEMNRQAIPDAKSLKPGTVLRLPGDASRVRLVPEG